MAPQLRWIRRAPQGVRPNQENARLGVLGGTFNPVTRAHLKLAQVAREQFGLDEVLFILPEALPHRLPQEATVEQRLALLEAGVAPYRLFSVAVCSHGLFLEMAQALAPHYPPGTRVFFLVGSDAAERILLWNYPEPNKTLAEMFARFDLVVARRGGRLAVPSDSRLEPFRGQIHFLALPDDCREISASAVREGVRLGQPIENLVPPAVAEAIRQAGLYRA